jgi:hypothetical protein
VLFLIISAHSDFELVQKAVAIFMSLFKISMAAEEVGNPNHSTFMIKNASADLILSRS